MAKETTKKKGRIASTIAELRHVSWPTFSEMLKKLGSVLVITGLFLVVFMGFDALFMWFYSVLVMGVVGTWNEAGGYFITYDDSGLYSDSMTVTEMMVAAIICATLIVCTIVAVIVVKVRNSRKEF